MIKKSTVFFSLVISLFAIHAYGADDKVIKNDLRPSAYPLITIDPYTSGWAFTDKLYDGTVKHWTGKNFPLLGAIKVDNKVYRFMGTEDISMLTLVPTSEVGKWNGKYTTTQPAGTWTKKNFNDAAWKEGSGAFGTSANESTAKTNWESEYIWVRRTITLKNDLAKKKVYLEYSHDDDAIIYINGIEVVNTGNTCKKNALQPLSGEVLASLKKGENIIAGYCRNRVGNGLLDFGLVIEKENQELMPQTAIQKSVDVQATQTHYVFQCGGINLKLTFSAPLFMDDLKLLSRPVNYISYEAISNDGKAHGVSIYFEASTAWSLDKPMQKATLEGFADGDLFYLKTGSVDQQVLAKQGDDVRIDWGYFFMVSDKKNIIHNIGDSYNLRKGFINGKQKENTTKRESATNRLSLTQPLGNVTNAVAGKIMLGYDDIYSVQYFGKNLRPYWNSTNDQTIVGQFHKANQEYNSLIERCYTFDKTLMTDATKAGGKEYAGLCAVAYRQAVTAHKLVEAPNGDLLFLSKENFSNGSIGTVDVTYPSSPLFLYYNPELAKGLMNFIYFYSESGKWTKPYPSHDIGTYPIGNGQTYGGDMPVEESGNMLVLTAAVAAAEGNARYAEKHWNVLTTWTDYLVDKGLNPENQLCTDDFAGHFAHNTNLSIKAIMGVASYAYLAEKSGKKQVATEYYAKARHMATEWEKLANDGDHYRLTFDKQGTWSQKYNLVWDKLLKTNIFPKEIAEKEIKYYLTKQNKYGLPLDNRETYTKTDWIMWTATMANDKATFEQFIKPVYLFMNETTDRIPMSDWVYTDKPNQRGFQARSVVGGYFIKMLENKLK